MAAITGTPISREHLLRLVPRRPLTKEQAYKRNLFEEALLANRVRKLKGHFPPNIQKIIDIWTLKPSDAYLAFMTEMLDFSTAPEKCDSNSILRSFHTLSPHDLLLAAKRFPADKIISLIGSFTVEAVPRLKGTLLPLLHSFDDLTFGEVETLAQTCKNLGVLDDPDIQEALAMRCSEKSDPEKLSACLGVPISELGHVNAMTKLLHQKKGPNEIASIMMKVKTTFQLLPLRSLDAAVHKCRRFILNAPRHLAMQLLKEPHLLPGDLKIELHRKQVSIANDTLLRRLIQFGTLLPEDLVEFVQPAAFDPKAITPAAKGKPREQAFRFKEGAPETHIVASEYNADDYVEDVPGENRPKVAAKPKRPSTKSDWGESALRPPTPEEPERRCSGSAAKKPRKLSYTSSWKLNLLNIAVVVAKQFLELHLLKAVHNTLHPEEVPTLSWDIYARARLLSTDQLLDLIEHRVERQSRDRMYTILPPLIHGMDDLTEEQLERLVRLLVIFGFLKGRDKMAKDGTFEVFHNDSEEILQHDEKDEDLKYIISMRCPPSLEHLRGYYRDQYGFTYAWTSKEALQKANPITKSKFGLDKRFLSVEESYFKTIGATELLVPIHPLSAGEGGSEKYCTEPIPRVFLESAGWRETRIPRDPDPPAVCIRKRMIACSPNPMDFIVNQEKITKPVERFLPTNTYDDRIRLPMIDEKFVRFLIRIGVIHPDAVTID